MVAHLVISNQTKWAVHIYYRHWLKNFNGIILGLERNNVSVAFYKTLNTYIWHFSVSFLVHQTNLRSKNCSNNSMNTKCYSMSLHLSIDASMMFVKLINPLEESPVSFLIKSITIPWIFRDFLFIGSFKEQFMVYSNA